MLKVFKIIGKSILYILLLVVAFLIIVFIWLKSASPGETEPITDANGNAIENSIAELGKISIGGIDQFIIIRGKDINNPVLLMLHGGPGSPQAHMNLIHNKELEDHFVVVNWDQRAAGATYSDNTPIESINIDQFIEDTYQLSSYLAKRFNQEKIFILGHSWGSYLGMRTIHTHPELYHTYIGIGQVGDHRISEALSYDFVYEMAKKENNEQALVDLNEIGAPINGSYKNPKADMQIQRKWVAKFGGSAYGKDGGDMFDFFLKPLLLFKEYTLSQKLNYVKGIKVTQENIWNDMLDQQLVDKVKEVKIPIYIFQGRHDYQTVYEVAKQFIDSLKAPSKEFITFENSAHMLPYNQEVEKFNNLIINKVLPETLNRTDSNIFTVK